MTTLPDLIFVALLAVAWPLIDYFVYSPAFFRRSQHDPARARTRFYTGSIVQQWALVAVGTALWVTNNRSWTSLGFSVPEGWRLWASIALFLLLAAYHAYAIATVARSSDAQASMQQQFGKLTAVMPHTRTELYLFGGVSLTAGFCEEFLFRGYFIWLFAPWLGWWGAAALSVPIFASLHAYQGWTGVLRAGSVGLFFALLVAIFNSLWPAIALHVLVDLGAGIIAWLALRAGQVTHDVAGVEQRTKVQSAADACR